MTYGTLINGQLFVHPVYHEGDKPVVFTHPVLNDNEIATCYYEDDGEQIVQRWNVIPNPYEPIEADPTTDDIINILLGGDGE